MRKCASWNDLKHYMKARFRLYTWRYIAFARLRKFKSFNDWPYHRRSFLECWLEPGFHRFWQVWNPGISYFVYRLFRFLGGGRRWVFATIGAFIINGVIHTSVFYCISGKWSVTIIVTFSIFGILTVINKKLERILQQNRWPKIVNLIINISIVIISFDVGFRTDCLLH